MYETAERVQAAARHLSEVDTFMASKDSEYQTQRKKLCGEPLYASVQQITSRRCG